MEEDGQLLSYIRMMYGLPETDWLVRGEGDDESTAIVIQLRGDLDVQKIVDLISDALRRGVTE